MSKTFHLLDLPSQALAIQRLLSGRPDEEKLAWPGGRGTLDPIVERVPADRPAFYFESDIGLKCAFFIDGDEFVFLGDHATYRAVP